MGIFSVLSSICRTSPGSNPGTPIKQNDGDHLTSFIINHTGMAHGLYYMLKVTKDGTYFKYSDHSPHDWGMQENESPIEDNEHFRHISIMKSCESGKSVLVKNNYLLRKLEDGIKKSGALSWKGFSKQESLSGVSDAGERYTCYFQLANGEEYSADGYNVKPEGWDTLMEVVYEVFGQIKNNQFVPQESILDDKKATLLVDYCKRRVGTVGGNGYTEFVLYKDEDSGIFQIHTYEKYDWMEEESHKAYKTDEQAAKEITTLIEEKKIHKLEGKDGIPLCGGSEVLKFWKGNRLVRITSDNLPQGKTGILSEIGALMMSKQGEEILP